MRFHDLIFLTPQIFLIFSGLLALFIKPRRFFLPVVIVVSTFLFLNFTFLPCLCDLTQIEVCEFCNFDFYQSLQSPFLQSFISFSFVSLILNLSFFIVCIIFSLLALHEKSCSKEVTSLMIFSILGGSLMLISYNFISLYLSIEILSIPGYVLVAMNLDKSNNSYNAEASIKYFIFGSVASCIMLYGISIIYGINGTISFVIPNGQDELFFMGLVFLLIGLCAKIGIAPFHVWVPDVYQGSSPFVAAFLAIIPKFSVAVTIVYLAQQFFYNLPLDKVFVFIIPLSVWVSALCAIRQTNFRRMLGYSSVGNIAYVCSGIFFNDLSSLSYSLFYIISYIIATVGVFAFILRSKDMNLEDFAGLSSKYPIHSFFLTIFLLSMAGIPPFAGFFAKLFVLSDFVYSENYIILGFMILSSAVSVFYYLNIIRKMYFCDSSDNVVSLKSSPVLTFTYVACLLGVLFSFPAYLFIKSLCNF